MRRAHSSVALISSASASSTATAIGGRAGRTFSSETNDVELRDLAHLNSNLNLDLAEYQLDGVSNSNNSRVESDNDDDDEPVLTAHGLESERAPTPAFPHVTEPEDDNSEDDQDADNNHNAIDRTSDSRADSHASFHLTKNTVSQQLRSMSQLSGQLSNSSEQPMPADTWTFHYRERSGNFLSASAIDLNFNPGRSLHVAREHDASSSVYSRPTSSEVDHAVPEPYELPADLVEATVGAGDWPLKKEESYVQQQAEDEGAGNEGCSPTDEDAHITIVEAALPTLTASLSTPTLLEFIHDHDGKPSRAPSHKSGSSSTTKRSRFLERFTPPKKSVTKRRSIFKFLRAGSRRNQVRSISTPALCSPHLRPYVDGPADENETITVQYDLSPPESNPPRSISLGNLAVPATNESQGVASSPDLRHKPSLAEYERHLSVVGDDRRLPSTTRELNINRLSQIEEDEGHEHVSAKNSFSYHSKPQMTDPLMEAALERQLREKALFRSTSKRSIPQSDLSVTSFVATSWDEPSSLSPQSPDRDPLDSAGGQRPSAAHLSPPRTPVESRSRNSSFILNANQRPAASGKKPMILHTPSSISRSSIRSKIGSSLDFWSRYSSHTRGERCASAGRADNVRTLDFALDIKHERIRGGTDESDPFRPGSRTRVLTGKLSSRSKTKSLPKSRSATFGGAFARYYSTLFSSPPDFHGKGRRTSVTFGGKLHRPELEILSPIMPPCSSSPVSQSVDSYVHELEQLRAGPEYSPLVKKEQTAGSAGKGKSPVLSIKTDHLDVSGNPDSSKPPMLRGDSMFKPLSSEVPKESERSVKPGQDSSQPEGSDDYFSAKMGSSSKSNSQASSPTHAKDNIPSDIDGTIESAETAGMKTPPTITTTNTQNPTQRSTPAPILTPSKSQAWSELYQECLVVPPSPVDGADEDDNKLANGTKTNIMHPPPTPLTNTKLRSPASASLNPPAATHSADPTSTTSTTASTATIRRYPSVTVIDDRKGHWRSVSFISVQSGKSGRSGIAAAGSRAGSCAESFVRESSGDFLRMMEGREREERERLLGLGMGLGV